MLESSTLARVGRARSKSSRTIILHSLSRFTARLPELAEFCVIFLLWARGRWRLWIRYGLGRFSIQKTSQQRRTRVSDPQKHWSRLLKFAGIIPSSKVSSAVLPHTEIVLECLTSAVRPSLSLATRATRW